MESTHEPGRSKLFAVFEKNVARIGLVLKAPHSEVQAVDEKLKAQVLRKELVLADVKLLLPLVTEISNSITTSMTILTWAIPMLVTFTEVYLQDALALIVRSAFSPSTLPGPIVGEVIGKWLKGTMRSGNPHQWINQLKKFGATGYPEDLGAKLQNIWELRHSIIHSADLNKGLSLGEIMTVIATFC
jgi:hypothetical protein